MATIFEQIIQGEIPAEFMHQDDKCIAIKDINPAAPVHFLVIPRKVIPKLTDAGEKDPALLGHLLQVAAKLAREHGLAEGARFVINNGTKAQQTVFHLHIHVLGERKFNWPPG